MISHADNDIDIRATATDLYSYLIHQVRDRLLQIVNSVSHLVNSSDDGTTHLVESVLLQMLIQGQRRNG